MCVHVYVSVCVFVYFWICFVLWSFFCVSWPTVRIHVPYPCSARCCIKVHVFGAHLPPASACMSVHRVSTEVGRISPLGPLGIPPLGPLGKNASNHELTNHAWQVRVGGAFVTCGVVVSECATCPHAPDELRVSSQPRWPVVVGSGGGSWGQWLKHLCLGLGQNQTLTQNHQN
jgi:hypothetical protein